MDDPNYGDYQGQDDRGSQIMTAPPQPAAPAPAPRPSLPMSPAAAPGTVFSPDQQQSRAFWDRMRTTMADVPLDQAESAINAALKFQAIRGYQKDLESGKSAAEALTKWAPLMFTAPKSTLGQAAQMIKATRPPAPMIKGAGGQLYQVDQSGNARPITPPPTKQPRNDPFALADYHNILGQIKELQKDLDVTPAKDKPAVQAQIKALEDKAASIRSGAGTAPAPAPAPAPRGKNEVVRVTKDGRKAIFDSETKKFLRYAQ